MTYRPRRFRMLAYHASPARLLLLAFGLLVLAACHETTDGCDAVGYQPSGSPIAFSALEASVRSRAVGDGELTTSLLQSQSFGVYCWYTQGRDFDFTRHAKESATYVLMYNQPIVYDATESPQWTYTPSKYWPLLASEKLTFRAYAPYTATMAYDAKGMPLLPVTVASTDYHNGTQHDPLWGTGCFDGEERFGALYNDYTCAMSGSALTTDSRDGTVDWYFHHGMAKLVFRGQLAEDAQDGEVTITGISVSPLYTSGQLDISSQARNQYDKPVWLSRTGDMTVALAAADLKPSVVLVKNAERELLDKGLLIIPRDFDGDHPLTITVTYETEGSVQHTATATLTQPLQGNTVYTFDMLVNPVTNAVSVRMRVNLDWQAGGYFLVDDL